MQKQAKVYLLVSQVQLILGTLLALILLSFYRFAPEAITDSKEVYLVAYLGAANILHYLTLHQLLKVKRAAISLMLQTCLIAAMAAVVIMYNGGLDSAFYFLWLPVVAALAVLGVPGSIAAIGLTSVYYLFALMSGANQLSLGHLVQYFFTLVVAVGARWMYSRLAGDSDIRAEAADLSMQLGQEQFKAQTLLNSMGEGAMVVNNNLQIEVWNPAAATMTGWSADNAISLNYQAVLGLKDAQEQPLATDDDPFRKAWTTKNTVTRDNLVATTKSGKKIPLFMTVSPVYDAKGQIAGGIALFRDITEEKETERQRNEFISTASHEMRTPVAAIEGYLALALNSKTATIDQRAKSYLEKAHTNTQHLGELFRDLLSITKLEDNKLAGKIEVFELSNMVSEVVESLQTIASKKALSLKFVPGFNETKVVSPLYYVKADPARLREVVTNLIDNAMKFTTQGGVTVTLNGSPEAVTVSVNDTGMGIAPEDLPHLFQKFYRVDNSSTRTIGGTGLGLYLCRSIIELYQGRIWAESELGKGSAFKFSLPRVEPPQNTSTVTVTPVQLTEVGEQLAQPALRQ